ncbi:MAG: hypothetical protein IPL32_10880 [Chloracidobacterium sp.]|nr:hypothetical protein [Chloracidobacterium sp.]
MRPVNSIFESFNARDLEPEEVARTFVPPDFFDDTSKRVNTLIIGPRGSGKTTVLKMLQPAALEAWSGRQADYYRESIDFVGVFVPADRSWKEQLDALMGHKLAIAAFTTHVLHSLIRTMHYRVHPPINDALVHFHRVSMSRKEEAVLVKSLAKLWHLDVAIPSLIDVKHALTARMNEIGELGTETSENPQKQLRLPRYVNLHFLRATLGAIELFNDLTQQSTQKWALLFDELELAPEWLVSTLLGSLRGLDNRIILKLSMCPYAREIAKEDDSNQIATLGNDYNQVALWYSHKEDGYKFCNALFHSLIKEHSLPVSNPSELLGFSNFETLSSEYSPRIGRSAYEDQSRLQQVFVEAAKKDRSFKDFISAKQLDLKNLDSLNEDQRAAGIRKVRTLVAVREAFRKGKGEGLEKSGRRSPKNLHYYAGATSLFSIVEGNPRLFIGIIGQLIQDYKRQSDLTKSTKRRPRKISAHKQGLEVEKAVNKYRAYLQTIPCPPLSPSDEPRGVLTLLDRVGKFFNKRVILDDFVADPPLTFIIDDNAPNEMVESLGKALNAGAIVFVNEKGEEVLLKSLRGKRFRLSYLLAPSHRLPLILGKARSLSLILKQSAKWVSGQAELFHDDD